MDSFGVNIMQQPRVYLSQLLIVVVNSIPLFGVLLYQWDITSILFLFWLETGIIGFYNILKMVKVGGVLVSIIAVPFFIVHFGGFMAGHLIFIFALFSAYGLGRVPLSGLFPPFSFLQTLLGQMILPFVAMVISHGVSFFRNFIEREEYKTTDIQKQMSAPYSRIIVMHFVVLLGGWMVLATQSAVWSLVLLVIFKTMLDMLAHNREHARGRDMRTHSL